MIYTKWHKITSAKQRLLVMKDVFQSEINNERVESSVSDTWYLRVALNSPVRVPEAFLFELRDRSGKRYATKINRSTFLIGQ